MFLPSIIVILASMTCLPSYYSWSKSNIKEVVQYADSAASRDSINILIRPEYEAPLINYYFRGRVQQYDETYLNGPLGPVIDTARAFVLISLDAKDEIRDYFDLHFRKISERTFPAEARMGLVVGAYQRIEEE